MEVTQVHKEIPIDIPNGSILNICVGSVTQDTHGFHKYPAKFIPQIPGWAIKKYLGNNKGKLIIDPFSGSGTTLVESVLSGNAAVGIDIDPLSVLIAKVKTTPLDIKLLNTILPKLKDAIENPTRPLFKPECTTLNHWFPQETIEGLSKIRTAIEETIRNYEQTVALRDIYDFLIICFSSIIRRVSYADNESQKTYVSHTHIKEPAEVYSSFYDQLDYFVERITSFSEIKDLGHAKVIRASSSEPINVLMDDTKADLAVTSPPYIKAIDYIYNQMVELFWIGDLFGMDTQTKQNNLKQKYVGNKHILFKEYANFTPEEHQLGISELDLKNQEVFKTDAKNGLKHSYVVYKYFTLMDNHFNAISECLKPGAHYVFVVGDSDVSNIHFNTADYLTEQAARYGLTLTNRWGYIIKNRFMRFDRKGRGGKIDIDWVLDFQKD